MRHCAGPCGRPLGRRSDPARGIARHDGRGLCTNCHRNEEVRLDHPRVMRCADEVLDDWDVMRRGGVTRLEAAARLGITEGALHRLLERHRDDPRAKLGQRGPIHTPVRDETTGRWVA